MDSITEGLNTSGKINALMGSRTPKITQKDIAELLGVTSETISNRLAANRWDVKDLDRIAAAYNVDVQDLKGNDSTDFIK